MMGHKKTPPFREFGLDSLYFVHPGDTFAEIADSETKLGGGFKSFFIFTPILEEMIQFDGCIFFKWVGATTN